MYDKKEDIIFNLNNILLSAYEDKKGLSDQLRSENEEFLPYVEDSLKVEYEKIKAGKKIEVETDDYPTIMRAINFYSIGEYEQCMWDALRILENEKEEYLKCIKIVILSLLELQSATKFIKKFIPIVKENIDKDEDMLDILANIYFKQEDYAKALPVFEKLVQKYPNDRIGYNYNYKLAYIYERVYQDQYLDKQIELTQKAASLTNDDNGVICFLAKLYHRKGLIEKSDELFTKAMNNNPKPDMMLGYAHYLMNTGRLKQGYDVYRNRFKVESIAYPKVLTDETRWDGKSDLSDCDVIVHYEQGFGDSVMFSRYIPDLAKMAKSITFVAQKNLISLFKSSGFDKYCHILSHEADINPNFKAESRMSSEMFNTGQGMLRIPHDYHIPLADLPYLFDASPENMVHTEGYLKVDADKIEAFRKKYLKNSKKIKVGFAYHGTKASVQTYRDIQAKKLMPLFKMKELEFYSFQADENSMEIDKLDKSLKVHNLAKHFKTFEDTACAMCCMDLIISTDNVILNLAGALGVKAYGLFNIYPEARWYKTSGEDIGWYKSVKPFRVKTFNAWNELMHEVKDSIKQDFNL
ncbi:MAG: tetratricopeptide repeat protein [Cyanobacteria bacterium RUI128]|nr:tetratricopeptide repeat protein [Cyanobacteria bacterium RUI128]